MKKRALMLCSIASAAAMTGYPAYAQQSTPASTVEAETGIADIVVTAQRREETAQRAALAVDVVSASTLQNAGVVTAATLNAAVPSLYVTKAGGANSSFFIRGVGNFTNNGYSDPAIAFNVDGVYYGRPTSTTGTFYDLDRIEVLKGPQGTLYGRNATGGAINIIPAKPRIGEFSGYLSGGYGRFEALDLEGAFNAPLGERGAIRIAGKLVNAKGYNDDGTSDEVGQAFRVQLLGELTENFKVRVAGDYSHNGGVGVGASFNGVERYTPGTAATGTSPANYTFVPAGLGPRTGMLSPTGTAYYSTVFIGGPGINPAPLNTPFLDNTYVGANAEFTLKTGVGTLTFIPAWRDSKVKGLFNGPAFRGGLTDEHDEQFTAEARFDGKRIGPIDWLIGGFYYDEKIRGTYTFSQYTIQSYQQFDTGTKSLAAFGRLTAHVSDAFRVVGAVRYTDDKKFFNGASTTLVEICAAPSCIGGPSVPVARSFADVGALIPPALLPQGLPTLPGPANSVAFGANGNRLFYVPLAINTTLPTDKVTYRLAAEYDLGPSSLLYASYETGYRSGGFALAAGKSTYAPETITAITIGSKNRFFNNRVQFNVEAFRWTYKNQQVSHFGFDVNGNNAFFTENIGQSRIQGVDIDTQFKATQTTLLRASVQYLDNKLTSFSYNTPRGGTSLPPVVGCPYTNGTDGAGRTVYVVDCSGKQGFNSPEWSINAGIEQTVELGDYKLVFTGDGRYRSNRVVGFDYLPQENSGSDVTFDASLMLARANDKWSITAWVRNLTDQTVPVLSQFAGSTGNVVATAYAAPRTYGVRARVNF